MQFFKRAVIALQVLTFLFCAHTVVRAQDRGPSTKTERTKVIQLAKESEKDVFNASFQSDRAWFMKWMADIPDISLELGPVGIWCMNSFPESPEEIRPNILYQYMISAVVFIIENPSNAKDFEKIDKAGVEGVLRAYENFILKHPESKIAPVEEAIKLRDKGNLQAFINNIRKEK